MGVGRSVTMGPLAVKIVFIALIMVMITDGRPDNLIPNVQRYGFPEIPEPAPGRLTGPHAASKPAKHNRTDNKSHHLQHHELGNLQTEHVRQRNVMPARQLEEAEVANVMKGIV